MHQKENKITQFSRKSFNTQQQIIFLVASPLLGKVVGLKFAFKVMFILGVWSNHYLQSSLNWKIETGERQYFELKKHCVPLTVSATLQCQSVEFSVQSWPGQIYSTFKVNKKMLSKELILS